MLARVELNATAQVDAPTVTSVVEERVVSAPTQERPKRRRRLVHLGRRGEQAPAANVLALPANLGRNAPSAAAEPVELWRTPTPDRTRRWGVALFCLVLGVTAAITIAVWPPQTPLTRTLRTLQSRVARTLSAALTPIDDTLSIEPLDIEFDAETQVVLVHGVVHNGTPTPLADTRIVAVLEAGGRPIRRRVVRCCDELDMLTIADIGPTHPHLSQGGARRVRLDPDVQETVSILFRGIEAHHFKGELSARLTIQHP